MSTKHFTANVISATKVVPDGNFGNSAAQVYGILVNNMILEKVVIGLKQEIQILPI